MEQISKQQVLKIVSQYTIGMKQKIGTLERDVANLKRQNASLKQNVNQLSQQLRQFK